MISSLCAFVPTAMTLILQLENPHWVTLFCENMQFYTCISDQKEKNVKSTLVLSGQAQSEACWIARQIFSLGFAQ